MKLDALISFTQASYGNRNMKSYFTSKLFEHNTSVSTR